jgi:hypothetical protein
MMDRRVFLKLTGLVAAASALEALPVAAARRPDAALAEGAFARAPASASSGTRLTVREPGTYRITGLVRLVEPRAEIRGITHPQSISWSNLQGSEHPVAGFTTFEHFERPGTTPAIHIYGGHLEAIAIQPVDFE